MSCTSPSWAKWRRTTEHLPQDTASAPHQAFWRSQNLAAGGIHFRRGCSIPQGSRKMPRILWERRSSWMSCTSPSWAKWRRTTEHLPQDTASAPHQAFWRSQNLAAGGIHFRRGCSIPQASRKMPRILWERRSSWTSCTSPSWVRWRRTTEHLPQDAASPPHQAHTMQK